MFKVIKSCASVNNKLSVITGQLVVRESKSKKEVQLEVKQDIEKLELQPIFVNGFAYNGEIRIHPYNQVGINNNLSKVKPFPIDFLYLFEAGLLNKVINEILRDLDLTCAEKWQD